MLNKRKAISILVFVALLFALFQLAIYEVFTKRCLCDYSPEMQARSVEISKYLPFDDHAQTANCDTDFQLTGELPILDSAAALYPITASIVNAVYPSGCYQYDATTNQFSDDSSLQMNNTPKAYKKIVDGDTDIALLAPPSEEQKAYAEEKGVSLEFVPVGKEAFVFLVNADNPINSLTTDQIRDIYSGKVHNWSELGGKNAHIAALQRNEGSGSQSSFLRFMGDMTPQKDYLTFLGSAIGFSFRFYVDGMVADNGVKMLALDGVFPSKENVRNESYPIVNTFFAVYRTDNANPNVKKLLEWMFSDECQGIIEDTGYVSVNG